MEREDIVVFIEMLADDSFASDAVEQARELAAAYRWLQKVGMVRRRYSIAPRIGCPEILLST